MSGSTTAPSLNFSQSGRKNSTVGSSALGGNRGGAGNASTGGFVAASAASANVRDNRPVRDRTYQNQIATAVFEYLVNNNFEGEANHAITARSLKSPTQKDFVKMFQWLYRRVDPDYRFTKSIENEVIPLMKAIGYPAMDTLSKSQLVAVGGQNWGAYLAMLHWLVDLAETFDAVENKEYDEGLAESEDGGLNQIVIAYITKAYCAFLQNVDDYSEYEIEMREAFEQRIAAIEATTAEYTDERARQEQEIRELEENMPSLEAVHKKSEALESDLGKFEEYIENMEKRKAKWASMLGEISAELATMEVEFAELEKERAAVETKIAGQGFTPADIDGIVREREQLCKTLQASETRASEVARRLQEKEAAALAALETLEGALHKYNSLGYRIGIMPAKSNGKSYEITLDAPLSEEHAGRRPSAVAGGVDVRHEVRPLLQKLRMEGAAQVHRTQDEAIRLQSLLDRVAEVLADKQDEAETLTAQISAAKLTYDEGFETMASDASTSHAEIEKLERKIQVMRLGVQDGRVQLEQRAERAVIEQDHMQHAAERVREQMRVQVGGYLERVVAFKLHVQGALEEHESFVVDELDAWRRAHVADEEE
ncbi:HEC/Ndc80p family-domain-containing protein [Limtongia smithiae]|uniref:HEC/Ndc80p family-domain-containing protein n=1 Tax=Limtongia smithiae TaxID=1125753 RepID=UPI0034D01207